GTWALAEAAILPGPIICPAWVVAGMRVLDGGAAALLVGIDGATVRISIEDEEPATVRLLP
ncbi:MAG: hypothetical protein NZ761_11130, partial [Dehalococcoidia bacterium]|nr:hypothetical protein [Dehalococcoidia bacterium]